MLSIILGPWGSGQPVPKTVELEVRRYRDSQRTKEESETESEDPLTGVKVAVSPRWGSGRDDRLNHRHQ